MKKTPEEIKSEFQKKLEKLTNEKSPTPKKPLYAKIIGFLIASPFIGLVFLGAVAYGAFAWGFVLYKFWQWFVLPVFTTLPQISISQAVGLMIVVQLFDKNIPQVFDDEFLNTDKKNFFDIISPIIAFVFGWIVWYFFIPLGF